jgi:hypothetical protein
LAIFLWAARKCNVRDQVSGVTAMTRGARMERCSMSVDKLAMTFDELVRNGGVEAYVRAAGELAMRKEREWWLRVLENYELPDNADDLAKAFHQSYVAGLRRKLGMRANIETVRAQTRQRVKLHRQRKRKVLESKIVPASG